MRNTKGIVSFVVVVMVSVVMIFLLLAWESRLLLAINRKQSFYDLTNASYRAEFETVDVVTKMLFYPSYTPGTYSQNIGAGKTLDVNTTATPGGTLITFLAKWPYASNNMKVESELISGSLEKFNKVEFIVGFDCSPSMNDPVSPSDSTHRITRAQQAFVSLVTNITNLDQTSKDKYYLGIIATRRAADWTQYPTNDHQTTLNKLTAQTWYTQDDAWICDSPNLLPPVAQNGAGTNLGAPGMVADGYYSVSPMVKKIFVLITDGLPNTALTNANCGTSDCSLDENNGGCSNQALNYLACSLAPQTYQWSPGTWQINQGSARFGQKPDEVDSYAVLMAPRPEDYVPNSQYIYDKTIQMLNTVLNGDKIFVKKTYTAPDSYSLANVFSDVIETSITSATSAKLNFKRFLQ